MTFNTNTKHQRLFGAAGVLLKAMRSQQGMNSNIAIHSARQCANTLVVTRRYTLMEMVDAMSMLIGIGVVPGRQKSQHRSSHSRQGPPAATRRSSGQCAANSGTRN